jgi:transketolase
LQKEHAIPIKIQKPSRKVAEASNSSSQHFNSKAKNPTKHHPSIVSSISRRIDESGVSNQEHSRKMWNARRIYSRAFGEVCDEGYCFV